MITIGSNLRTEDERDRLTTAIGYTPTMWEGLGAKVKAGFDMTTTRILADEVRTGMAEREAYGGLSASEMMSRMSDFAGTGIPGEEPTVEKAVQYNQEDYKKSRYFREGIKWQDGWTEQRARIMAEDYDDRRYREEVLGRRAKVAGLGEQALGFGASLLGGLPDPLNLIPFAAGIKGATLVASMGRAAAEGALGTAISDALVVPDLKARGEDVGFSDIVADVAAGTVLGGLLGGAGYGISKALDNLYKRRAPALNDVVKKSSDEMGVVPPRETNPADFEDVLKMRAWDGVAPDSASRVADEISLGTKAGSEEMTPEDFIAAKLGVRTNISGVERKELYDLMEDAVGAVADGKAVDLGDALSKSEFYKKLPEEIRSSINTAIAKADDFAPVTERAEVLDKGMEEPVEFTEVKQLQDEGRLLPEEEESMKAAETAEKQIDSYEEAGLSIAECVWGMENA